jgi:hypothetical protein
LTIILPRRTRNWISATAWIVTYRVVVGIARGRRDPAARDRLLALLGPVNLIGLLFFWMTLFVTGFASIAYGVTDNGLASAIDLAGSSLFTLGFATGTTALSHLLMFVAAASGTIVVGLQIGYLPTIYAAYSARESHVTLLTMRAAEGGVTTGATILANHALPRSANLLATLFASWEANAAAIIESHTNYPWLIVFRSPRATESWVTSMLAMVDAVALLEALAPSSVPPESSPRSKTLPEAFPSNATSRRLGGPLRRPVPPTSRMRSRSPRSSCCRSTVGCARSPRRRDFAADACDGGCRAICRSSRRSTRGMTANRLGRAGAPGICRS